jgi:hypothetical protein
MTTNDAFLSALYASSSSLQAQTEQLRAHGRHDVADCVRDAGSEVLRAIGRLVKAMSEEPQRMAEGMGS